MVIPLIFPKVPQSSGPESSGFPSYPLHLRTLQGFDHFSFLLRLDALSHLHVPREDLTSVWKFYFFCGIRVELTQNRYIYVYIYDVIYGFKNTPQRLYMT